MVSALFGAIVISLAIVGLTELFKLIYMITLFSKNEAKHYSVIIPNDSDVEYSVRAFVERERWNYFCAKTKLVVITDTLSVQSVKICKKLAREYGDITVLSEQEFSEKYLKG